MRHSAVATHFQLLTSNLPACMRAFRASIIVLLVAARGAAAQAPSLAHARQLFDARSYDAARVELLALAQAAPFDAAPHLYLGRIAQTQGDAGEALRQLERCVALNERNASCHFFIGEVLGTSAARASKLRLPFLARRTKREFDRAVELDPDYLDARMGLIQYYLRAPGFLGGSVDKARVQATEITRRSALRGALASGAVAEHQQDLGAAEALFLAAIAAQPDSGVGYRVLAALYTRSRRYAEASATLGKLEERTRSREQ